MQPLPGFFMNTLVDLPKCLVGLYQSHALERRCLQVVPLKYLVSVVDNNRGSGHITGHLRKNRAMVRRKLLEDSRLAGGGNVFRQEEV